MAIHQTAIIEDGARLGDGVDIGPFCIVGPNVCLDDGVRLLSHVTVSGDTCIGARSTVYPHAAIGGDGQIRRNDFAEAKLIIGEDTIIREGVTMNGGSRKGGGITKVGARGYFMAYAHIGHDCQVGDDVTFANGSTLGGHVSVGDGVIMGGLAAVQQFCRIGRYAMVGGVTGVNRDIIPYGLAFGDHAVLEGLNLIGLKRRGIPRPTIHALRSAYRAIFRDGNGSLKQRAHRVAEAWPKIPQIIEIVEFILADSKQPLCTARSLTHSDENT